MNTPLTASVVARFLGIEVAGNNIFIECVSDVMEPLEKSILFIDKEQDQKIYDEINSIKSLAVITNIDISKRLNCTVIISNNPKYDYSKIISKFFWVNYDHEMLIGENENAVVSELDGIDPSVKIGSNTIISSDVTINKNTTIGHNSIIKGPCEIGEGVEIGSNTIIGADGFGYAFRHKLGYKIRHIGGVRIGDHVDIGDQCHIAKGTIRDTIIGNHVKINAQVRIAHNVNIGNRVIDT